MIAIEEGFDCLVVYTHFEAKRRSSHVTSLLHHTTPPDVALPSYPPFTPRTKSQMRSNLSKTLLQREKPSASPGTCITSRQLEPLDRPVPSSHPSTATPGAFRAVKILSMIRSPLLTLQILIVSVDQFLVGLIKFVTPRR